MIEKYIFFGGLIVVLLACHFGPLSTWISLSGCLGEQFQDPELDLTRTLYGIIENSDQS